MSRLVEEVLRERRLPPPSMRRAIRVESGVSQERLAAELGVTRVSVARYEAGSRTPRGALCRAYARLLDELQEKVLGS